MSGMAGSLRINQSFIFKIQRVAAVTRWRCQAMCAAFGRIAFRRKWTLATLAVIWLVILVAVPDDWGPLDLMKIVLDNRDANFEGPDGKPWKRLLDSCPTNMTCIHLATNRFGSTRNWDSVMARQVHPSCSNDCQLVSDPRQAHALMFHIFDVPSRRRLRKMHTTRRAGQAWIMYNIEPPIHVSTSKCYYTCDYLYPIEALVSSLKEQFLPSYLLRTYPDTTEEAGFFNWTMTYRRDSTFYVPYASFGPIAGGVTVAMPSPAQLVSKKKHLMFAAVSNCHPYNRREEVLRELESVMELHVYGRCGSRRMAPGESTVSVSEQYYFYLSFENSFCRDYITEKFFVTGLTGHAVPVVFGGMSKAEYEAVAPPRSFIYYGDFPTASALAEHLRWLASNPAEYARHKEWRATHGMVFRENSVQTNPFCSICTKLKLSSKQVTRLDLNRFYNTGVECRAPQYWPFNCDSS